MQKLLIKCVTMMLAVAFFATACAGESTNNGNTDNGNTRTSAPNEVSTNETNSAADPSSETTADPETATPTDPPTASNNGGDPQPNIYQDPRGGIFAEFQQSFDRSDHPFTQTDHLCLPHEPAVNRTATDEGISAEAIRVGHIRSRLEDGINLGFGVPVGNPKEMFEVFIDYINDTCGGIRGRMLDLGYAQAALIGDDVEASRNAACLAMTEDHKSVIVMNSSGFQGTANLCLVEEQQTIFISTQGQTEEFMDRSNGRLVSLSPTLEESLRFMVTDLLASGALEGLTLGVAAPNTPGQVEAVEQALVEPLREEGFEVVFDVIDCAGTEFCTGGVPASVANMVEAGVNGFFNVLNIISAPGYIAEMANQGYEPGSVRFFASDFNSQTSEIVASQIANNVAAGELYNGATIFDYRTTGIYRDPNYQPNPILETCNEIYSQHSPSGASHAWDTPGDSAYRMVGMVCAIVRVMARALYDAGNNPTLDDVREAITNLGPVDNNAMTPASIRPDKTQMADAIQTLDFSFPCAQPLPFERRDGDPICVTGRNDFRPAPR